MKEFKKTSIFGLLINHLSLQEVTEKIFGWIRKGEGGVVYCCTMNEVMMVNEDVKLKKILSNKNAILTPDGMPLVWELKLKGFKKAERVYGPELLEGFINQNKSNKIEQLFIGDEKNRRYFEKLGSYVALPYRDDFKESDYTIMVNKIKKSRAKLVWLGLGAKKQIVVADQLHKRLPGVVLITVGAAFDFISKNKKQAPKWLRGIGGEWLFRCLQEPKRLAKRYFKILMFLAKKTKILIYPLLSVLLVLPQLWVKYPGLIDDGSDMIQMGKENLGKIFWGEFYISERTWPFRLFFKKILFQLFHLNMWGYYLVGGLILGLICLLIVRICKKIGVSKNYSFIVPLIILFLPSVYANFYRLGTAEPLQLLFILLVYYFWLREEKWKVWLFSFFCLFSKENSWFLVAVFVWLSVGTKNKKYIVTMWMTWLGYFLIVLYKYLRPESVYIHQAGLTLNYLVSFIRNDFISISLDFLAVISLGMVIFKERFNKKIFVLVFLWIGSLLPILLWNYSQGYYQLIHQVMAVLIIFLGLSLGISGIKHLRNKYLEGSIFVGFIVAVTYVFFRYDLPIVDYWHKREMVEGNLTEFLLKHDWVEVEIYSGISDYESNHKIFLYSNDWKNKPAKNFFPEINEWISHDFNDHEYFERQAELAKQNFIKTSNRKIYISNKDLFEFDGIYDKITICGESPFMKKECRFVIYYDKETRDVINGVDGE